MSAGLGWFSLVVQKRGKSEALVLTAAVRRDAAVDAVRNHI